MTQQAPTPVGAAAAASGLVLLALFFTSGIPRRQPGATDPAPTG